LNYEEGKSEKVENNYVNRNMMIGKYVGNGFEVHGSVQQTSSSHARSDL
jgi:hypothetical protein